MAGSRQKARTLVLQALFEADLTSHPAAESLERFLQETPRSAEAEEFARGLVQAVAEHQQQLDEVIQEAAPQWPVRQIAAVDRTLLRIAIAELMGFVSLGKLAAPAKATINEAVELAKRFGSEGSPRFVNGVLGSIASTHLGLAPSKAH